MNKIVQNVSDFFNFKERSATFKKEIIGGLSTFLAMAYILAVNPGMLLHANGGSEYAGVFFLGTAIASMIATLAMGLFANVPVALAPGMGVNAFFTYTVAGHVLNMNVEQALIATFCSGILYAIIAVTPFRSYLAKILPKNVKLAIGAMIGLFLAYIGLSDAGIIVSGAQEIPITNGVIKSVATNTKLGNLADPFVIIAIITMLLVFVLHFLKVKGSAVIAMLSAIVMLAIAYAAGAADADKAFTLGNYSDFGKFGKLSKGMWSSFGSTFLNGKAYIAIFVFLYIDFFDTTGTLFSVGEQAGLNKSKDTDKWMKRANIVDAGATVFGSLMLTSTTTSYVESTVGVSQGAKTGFASVVTGLLFALAIAIWPIMTPMMPIEHVQNKVEFQSGSIMPVTGPILVMVGALMISQLKHFNWKQSIDIPMLFITLVIGMLAYSISAGIAAGVIVYYVLNVAAYVKMTVTGKPIEIDDTEIQLSNSEDHVPNELPDLKQRVFNPIMILMVVLAIVYFATMPIYA